MSFFQFARVFRRPAFTHRLVATQAQSKVLRRSRPGSLALATVFGVAAYLAYKPGHVHLDSHVQPSSFAKEKAKQEDTVCRYPSMQSLVSFVILMHTPISGSSDFYRVPKNYAHPLKHRYSATESCRYWCAYCLIFRYKGVFGRILCRLEQLEHES